LHKHVKLEINYCINCKTTCNVFKYDNEILFLSSTKVVQHFDKIVNCTLLIGLYISNQKIKKKPLSSKHFFNAEKFNFARKENIKTVVVEIF
jgi:hypothetical protein